MGKCLVTRLNGIVANESLLHVGEMVVEVEGVNANSILFNAYKGSISCDRSFMLGTETVNANEKRSLNNDWTDIKSIDAGSYRFHFFDKYSIYGFIQKALAASYNGLCFLKNANEITITPSNYFDLSNIASSAKLTRLSLGGKVAGDISCLSALTALVLLSLGGDTYGDISSVRSKSSIVSLRIGSPKITFNSDKLKEFSALGSFIYEGRTAVDFGDIATFGEDFSFIDLDTMAKIRWTTRNSPAKIIGINNSPTLDNIDKMLQDQAECETGITSSTPSWMKVITAKGTRTSASDAAVQTLQSKGYTVSITPALDIV
jgi:hypothetical protein